MSNLENNPTPSAVPGEEAEQTITITPRVDVIETENEFVVLADLPGILPEDVDVRFEKGELSLHGQRAATRGYGPTTYHRSFAVADSVAGDKISAELKAGVLKILLPKVEAVKPKKIVVNR